MLSDALIVLAQTSYLAILVFSHFSCHLLLWSQGRHRERTSSTPQFSSQCNKRNNGLLICVKISYSTFLSSSSSQTHRLRGLSQIRKELPNSERFITFCSGLPNMGLLSRCWEINHSFLAKWSRSSKTVECECVLHCFTFQAQTSHSFTYPAAVLVRIFCTSVDWRLWSCDCELMFF